MKNKAVHRIKCGGGAKYARSAKKMLTPLGAPRGGGKFEL